MKSEILRSSLLICFFALFTLSFGCERADAPRNTADTLIVKSGNNQYVPLNSECPKELIVEVLSPRIKGLLGGKGARHPLAGITVKFKPLAKQPGLEIIGAAEAVTDAAGHAGVKVRMLERFGDHYCLAYLPDKPEIQQTFKISGGIQISGDKQETPAGRKLKNPISLKLTDRESQPISEVPIYFTMLSGPGKNARLSAEKVITDQQGMASVQFTTDPRATGKYSLMAEVACREKGLNVRGIRLTAMSMNRVALAIAVLGGLGIFILGMNFMSSGLQQVAGNRLKSIIQFFTRNRFSAIAAGTVITAMVQSSSASTVMVVGLVNAGLLGLRQAVGIIFGANIGTTVTGQMISFKLDGIALPAITVGMIMYILFKSQFIRKMGQTIFGFGLLFLGMQMMGGELKSVAELPSFAAFFRAFDCTPGADGTIPVGAVFGAIFIGTAMTVLVQSSSATIGLTIALASSGLINFYTAVPLILGDNIGTTITAILASIGTNRTARQAAVAHTIFNLVGAAYMVLLLFVKYQGVPVFLYIVDSMTAGEVFAETPENIGRHVAAAHTLFNVFNVIVFTPLLPLIAKICEKIIPTEEQPAPPPGIRALEKHLLATPTVALAQTVTALRTMTESAWSLVSDSYAALLRMDSSTKEELDLRESQVDEMQHQISQYLVELTSRQLLVPQAETVPVLLHCVNDAERIGDHAENLQELIAEMHKRKAEFSKKAKRDLDQLFEHVAEMATAVLDSLQSGSDLSVSRALKLEGKINRLTADFHKSHIKRLEKGQCSVAGGIVFSEATHNLERIADHLSNIAERVPQFRDYIGTLPVPERIKNVQEDR